MSWRQRRKQRRARNELETEKKNTEELGMSWRQRRKQRRARNELGTEKKTQKS